MAKLQFKTVKNKSLFLHCCGSNSQFYYCRSVSTGRVMNWNVILCGR